MTRKLLLLVIAAIAVALMMPGTAPAKTFKIGVTQIVSHPALDADQKGFEQALKDAGLDVKYDYQNAQGDMSNAQAIARKFKGDDLDLVHCIATPTSQAIVKVITKTPVVYSSVTDPVDAGLVKTMDAAGGNVTGVSDAWPYERQVKLHHEMVPTAKKWGTIYNAGDANSAMRRVERQARLLLQRYGILIKEWYRREQGLLNWHPLFQVLKRLEWQGEIRRGYFVSGLSGVQFALPEALDLLDRVNRTSASGDGDPIVISSLDPALPFGGAIDWGLNDSRANPLKVMRSASNHLVLVDGEIVMVAEKFFQRLSILKETSQNTWKLLTNRLQKYLKMPSHLKPTNRIEIHRINNLAAATSPLANHLLKAGFEKDGSRLVLWPSAAG